MPCRTKLRLSSRTAAEGVAGASAPASDPCPSQIDGDIGSTSDVDSLHGARNAGQTAASNDDGSPHSPSDTRNVTLGARQRMLPSSDPLASSLESDDADTSSDSEDGSQRTAPVPPEVNEIVNITRFYIKYFNHSYAPHKLAI